MEVTKSFGKHKHFDRLTFITVVKSDRRSITSYTAAPITPKHLRQLKRNVRSLVGSGLFPHEHKMFQCNGCKNCKRT